MINQTKFDSLNIFGFKVSNFFIKDTCVSSNIAYTIISLAVVPNYALICSVYFCAFLIFRSVYRHYFINCLETKNSLSLLDKTFMSLMNFLNFIFELSKGIVPIVILGFGAYFSSSFKEVLLLFLCFIFIFETADKSDFIINFWKLNMFSREEKAGLLCLCHIIFSIFFFIIFSLFLM